MNRHAELSFLTSSQLITTGRSWYSTTTSLAALRAMASVLATTTPMTWRQRRQVSKQELTSVFTSRGGKSFSRDTRLFLCAWPATPKHPAHLAHTRHKLRGEALLVQLGGAYDIAAGHVGGAVVACHALDLERGRGVHLEQPGG